MAENKPIPIRLRPIIKAYLRDLAEVGAYGENRSAVMRRFIESGIATALEAGVLDKKNVRDFGEQVTDADEEEGAAETGQE
jgi:hypothetical protein